MSIGVTKNLAATFALGTLKFDGIKSVLYNLVDLFSNKHFAAPSWTLRHRTLIFGPILKALSAKQTLTRAALYRIIHDIQTTFADKVMVDWFWLHNVILVEREVIFKRRI